MADRWLGHFLDALKENGLYDGTLVILTTDHGHMLGEHGFTGKNYMHAYNEMAHIPLFVKMPNGECAGEQRKQLTQNIDLMPTILKHHGIPVPVSVKGERFIGNDSPPLSFQRCCHLWLVRPGCQCIRRPLYVFPGACVTGQPAVLPVLCSSDDAGAVLGGRVCR